MNTLGDFKGSVVEEEQFEYSKEFKYTTHEKHTILTKKHSGMPNTLGSHAKTLGNTVTHSEHINITPKLAQKHQSTLVTHERKSAPNNTRIYQIHLIHTQKHSLTPNHTKHNTLVTHEAHSKSLRLPNTPESRAKQSLTPQSHTNTNTRTHPVHSNQTQIHSESQQFIQ